MINSQSRLFSVNVLWRSQTSTGKLARSLKVGRSTEYFAFGDIVVAPEMCPSMSFVAEGKIAE